MIHIIVASHGPLAEALLTSGRMVYGELPHVYAVTLSEQAGIEGFKTRFGEVLAHLSNARKASLHQFIHAGAVLVGEAWWELGVHVVPPWYGGTIHTGTLAASKKITHDDKK